MGFLDSTQDLMADAKVKFTKGFFIFDKFDFNDLSNIIDKTNSNTVISSNYVYERILESCFQIKHVQENKFFQKIFEQLNSKYNKHNINASIDIFFSFCAGGRSIAHKDIENVVIFGLFGKTIYLIDGKDYTVEKGDILFIPKGITHRAVGITPRIIGSFGTWQK